MWIRIEKPFVIPTDVRQILAQLQDAGHEAFLVGGSVRDLVRGVAIQDYDIATAARPEQVQALFSRVIEVGKAFGVMRVLSDSERVVEVATFRKEYEYRDHRHPQRVEYSDLESDASRRDFTINALYYDPKTSQVYDAFGGLEDLKQKVVRAIGEPQARFKEDALRLLRAVRFAARFGFQIEPQTRAAIREAAPTLRYVSVERIRDEIEKMLWSAAPKSAFLDLEQLQLLENSIPEIATARLESKKSWEQTLRILSWMGQKDERKLDPSGVSAGTLDQDSEWDWTGLLWAWVLTPSIRHLPVERRESELRKIGIRLKLSGEQIDHLAYYSRESLKFREVFAMREATLMRWMRDPWFPQLMKYYELDALAFDGNLAALEFIRSIYPDAKKRFGNKPLINGEDLVKLGMRPGRQFTDILRSVEDLVLEGAIQTKDQALEYVLKYFVK